ncbi:hypothetical protein [Vibrio campbellii]|uniref:hypothetical protein n=1 Tax=Vibrio campbellii TaxID=680 RepID=UPI00168CD172|nr:hypothetical protein [Vibrio campbellii]
MKLSDYVSKKTGKKLLVKELSKFTEIPVTTLQYQFKVAQRENKLWLINRLIDKAEKKKDFMLGAVDEAKESLTFELMKLIDAMDLGNPGLIAFYYTSAEKEAFTYKPHDEDTKKLVQAFQHIQGGINVAENKDFLLSLIHPDLTIHNGELMIREIVEGKGA